MINDFPTTLYVADVGRLQNDEVYEAMYQKVSVRRAEKTDRLKKKDDKIRSIAAEILLMRAYEDIIGKYYEGRDDRLPEVESDENGKPFFKDSNIFFNISHSGTKVICAISSQEVGCDVEKSHDSGEKIAKRFFAEEESALIEKAESIEEGSRLFQRIWTLKESVLKEIGLGVAFPMNNFLVVDEKAKTLNEIVVNGKRLYLKDYGCSDGYAYSCCCAGQYFADDMVELVL